MTASGEADQTMFCLTATKMALGEHFRKKKSDPWILEETQIDSFLMRYLIHENLLIIQVL